MGFLFVVVVRYVFNIICVAGIGIWIGFGIGGGWRHGWDFIFCEVVHMNVGCTKATNKS